jgi:hypothetical protein
MTDPVTTPKPRKPRTKRDLAEVLGAMPADQVSTLCADLWKRYPKATAILQAELAATKPK